MKTRRLKKEIPPEKGEETGIAMDNMKPSGSCPEKIEVVVVVVVVVAAAAAAAVAVVVVVECYCFLIHIIVGPPVLVPPPFLSRVLHFEHYLH